MKKTSLLLFLLLSMAVVSQEDRPAMRIIDSLNHLLSSQSGNQKIRTLQALVEQYRTISPAKSISTAENALKSSEFDHRPEAQIALMQAVASSAQFAGDLELAEEYYLRAIGLSRSSNNLPMLGHLLTALGNQYQRQGRQAEAQALLNEALELAQKLPNDTIAMKASIELGNLAFDAGEISRAMDYYRKSLELSLKLNDENIKAKSLLNMGMANWQFDNNDRAIELLNQSARLFEMMSDSNTLGMVYNNLGLIYFNDKKQYDSADHYFRKSRQIREQLGSPIPIAHVMVNQANLLTATGQFDKAILLYNRALKIFGSAGIRSQIARVHYHLGEAYESTGQKKAAIGMFEYTLELAMQDELTVYEDLARQKLLDLYAATGNWKAFMDQFAGFRKQHNKLSDDFNALSVREIQLQDSLQEFAMNNQYLREQNQALERKSRLLESVIISIASLAAFIVVLMLARQLIRRLLPKPS